MKTLKVLFLDESADMFWAGSPLTKTRAKSAKTATSKGLHETFKSKLAKTGGPVKKLETVFLAYGENARNQKGETFVSLLKADGEIASENKSSPTIRAARVSAAQEMEHFGIAPYSGLRQWAEEPASS